MTTDELKKSVRAYLAEIGRKGGSSKSEAKRRASRENGKKGGKRKGDRNQPQQ